ncbi:MAG: glucose-1-phosphate adenylyltransferase, partial [Synergistaceae bacterium]|nr:glucose-1-phosphate adenylyltransferase [Synergistaceae bacterium]
VESSVLSRNCVIMPGSSVEESIIGEGVVVGENCRLKRVIIDSHNVIPPNTVLGCGESHCPDIDDEQITVDPASGIIVVGMPKMQLRKSMNIRKKGYDWSSFS